MKKIIVMTVVLSIIFSFTPVFAADNTQPSAADKTPAAEAIGLGIVPESLQANGVQPITREGFIDLIMKAIEVKTGKSAEKLLEEKEKLLGKNPFADNNNQTVLKAYYLGLTDAAASGSFRPKDLLLRQEAAVILTNAAELLGRYTYNLPSNYKDKAKIDVKAGNSVDYVSHRKIMSGDGKGNFNPKDKCTTDQAIAAVLKLYKDDGVLNISQAERNKIAEAGRLKQAATRTGDTIYPQSGLNFHGQWTIKLGDVVGHALETSTAIYIDGRYVKSYAIGAYKAIDIDDLAQFGYIIKRDQKNKMLAIIRDGKAEKKEYHDKVDKSKVLSGNVIYTLIANDYRVKTFDSRSFDLSRAYSIPSYTTTTGKTLIPVEALKVKNHTFENEGRIAYVVPDPGKNEIRLHTVANTEVPFAMNRYWIANKYPELAGSLLSEQEIKALTKAQSIIKEVIKPGMSEFEREKAIYDYLVQYGAYDFNALNIADGSPINPECPAANPNAYNVYGALVDGLAVCEGWAEGYYMVLTVAGLECEIQIGSHGGTPHAWVSVKVDGEWFQIETTHKAEKGNGGFYHNAFNFTYEDGVARGYSGGDKRATSRKYELFVKREMYTKQILENNKQALESNAFGLNVSSTMRTIFAHALQSEKSDFEFHGIPYPTTEEERNEWRKLGYRFINQNATVDSDGFVYLKDLYE